MRKETESQWQANLDEARKVLSRANLDDARKKLFEIREALIFSWLIIHSTHDKEERIALGGDWGEAVKEEIELTKEIIAPAKKQLGLPLTNSDQERKVIGRAGKISKRYGGTIEQGKEIARRHIRFTKNIQRSLGVGQP